MPLRPAAQPLQLLAHGPPAWPWPGLNPVLAGNPAVFLRKLKPEEGKFLPESANHYARLAAEHAAETTKSLEQIAADKGLVA